MQRAEIFIRQTKLIGTNVTQVSGTWTFFKKLTLFKIHQIKNKAVEMNVLAERPGFDPQPRKNTPLAKIKVDLVYCDSTALQHPTNNFGTSLIQQLGNLNPRAGTGQGPSPLA